MKIKRTLLLMNFLFVSISFSQISMSLSEGNTISINGGMKIAISGHWVAEGEVVMDDASIEFNGSKDQIIYNPPLESFHNLIVNKTGGLLKFDNDIEVNNELKLSKGIIESTVDGYLILNENILVIGGNDSSFVIGPIKSRWGNARSKIFPFGKGTHYHPLEYTLHDNQICEILGTYTSTQTVANPIYPLSDVSDRYYYNIKYLSGQNISASIRLTYEIEDAYDNIYEIVTSNSSTAAGDYSNLGQNELIGNKYSGNLTSDVFNPKESSEYFRLAKIPSLHIEIPEQSIRYFSLPFKPIDNDFSMPNILNGLTPYYLDGNKQLYIPSSGLNSLNMDNSHGYKIYNEFAMDIIVDGSVLNGGTSLNLDSQTIQYLGYPYNESYHVSQLFGEYDCIKYIDDGQGNFYIPDWFITNMKFYPGRAYKVYSEDDIHPYVFPEITGTNLPKMNASDSRHEYKGLKLNGEMYVIIIRGNEDLLNRYVGSKFKIFDNNLLVGESIIDNNNSIAVVSWLENENLSIKGAKRGNTIKAKIGNNEIILDPLIGGKFGDELFSVLNMDIKKSVPSKNYINQNYPNPFNPTTKFSFGLPKPSLVQLYVFNSLGEEVEKIIDENKQAGTYEIEFNGSKLSSGVYLYRFIASDYTEIKKMIILK